MNVISGRISELLCERKMTQKELALVTNITEATISHYIKGDRVPRGANLVKVSNALGVTTDFLLGKEAEINKENDFEIIKTLIARNATQMTKEEKKKLLDILIVTFHTLARFVDFLYVFCQKHEFFGAILHDFCKMRAFSIENVAVTGRGVNQCH